jgi:hypothetical protein
VGVWLKTSRIWTFLTTPLAIGPVSRASGEIADLLIAESTNELDLGLACELRRHRD